ncbi:Tat pathway signal sequence domain protein [Thioalkalivibrio sp.]|uniref:Tat pathway signal sequence domain protein n=1 Tax=Thioalkalivibrio sp. TaxID=2093813 RepID=UPI003563615C
MVFFLMLVPPGVASAGDPAAISVQLNKLESDGADCRAHLVLENGLEDALESLQLDLVVFDGDGIIQRRTVIEMAPLRAGSTSVRAFRMADTACESVGRILVNDVAACEGPEGEMEDCADRIRTESLADVPLIR